MKTESTKVLEITSLVVGELNACGLEAIMVGGAVVSIYSDNEYKSKDIDLISMDDHKKITAVMESLGFKSTGREFFHPDFEHSVEFPSGPLGIGDDVPVKPEGSLVFNKVKIKVLSPSQCVMDRLAWFYFSNDRQCLDQALMVASKQEISLLKIKNWSKKEGELEKFEIFLKKLKEKVGAKK